MNIGLVIGSLRRESMSRKLATRLIEIAPASLRVTELEIGDLPLYNADLEAETPAAWTRLREGVRGSDGVLFVVPEYNRSLPAGVKNAVDVASKPAGQNLWPGRPVFVVAQSSGPLGGLAGSFALKQTLTGAGANVLSHPEIYLSRIGTLFAQDGKLVPDTQEFLRGALASFETFCARFAKR
ncbi:MAG TPA: NAD(P)H-dependent oxidoreductase [Ramlibacter sp.]|uniref:NADPH-dependent FMN reductase n=1 Tax=Ramlibacter sp. TaxID=1917967 RepID=UPI002D02CE0A|nr:NAD(P)H-dependent oxidoreductase [Ramlibacter sp.]HVZ42599.1 NAD(P)H-dependent oxidoreductase [Ramlibacter sp.]